ncbi:MAG: hypothetical protein ACXWJN_10180, partial [Methyloceanibacter sp.]
MYRLLTLFLVMLLNGAGARADPAEDCDKRSSDVAIAGCTALIAGNPKDVVALTNRGLEFTNKQAYDSA